MEAKVNVTALPSANQLMFQHLYASGTIMIRKSGGLIMALYPSDRTIPKYVTVKQCIIRHYVIAGQELIVAKVTS